MFTFRSIKDENKVFKKIRGKKRLAKNSTKTNDDDSDDDWIEAHEDEEHEPLEYDSDEEGLCVSLEEQSGGESTADLDEDPKEILAWKQFQKSLLTGMFETNDGRWFTLEKLSGSPRERDKENIISNLGTDYRVYFAAKDDVVDDMFPLYTADESINQPCLGYHQKDGTYVEHIAGPGCQNTSGYSGYEINADEMRGCQTLQCLVRKPEGYIFDSLPDDEEFEGIGEFFLSGLSDHMPSRDYSIPRVFPPRHDCETPYAENYMFDEDEAHDLALPFHPSCLEVYKRASKMFSGKIDINALTSWWSLEADYHLFHEFPRDPNVRACNKQEWSHHKGTEYLVANPLHIPKLRDIFASAVESSPTFSPRNGAFSIAEPLTESFAADPFASLPAELRFGILDCLPSKDIASLRCSSRAFCQLPVGYFQKLLARECPWLWEAWPTGSNPSSTRYAKWACLTATEVEQMTLWQQKELEVVGEYQEAVQREVPDLDRQVLDEHQQNMQTLRDAHSAEWEVVKDCELFYLPPTKTNYFTLYTLITRHWKDLRGLQNRKRIWKDCGEILKRASKYREEGRIGDDGITEVLRDVVIHNQELSKARDRRAAAGSVASYASITWVEGM